MRFGLRQFLLRDRGRLGWGRWRGRHLLSDVFLDSLQCHNVLRRLFLLGGELFQATPHDVKIGRQELDLLHLVWGRWSYDW